MIIKKGNSDGLYCWRTLMHGNPTIGIPCLAERCVAYQPHSQSESKQVSDAEAEALMAKNEGWSKLTFADWRTPGSPRNTMVRHVESVEGNCAALMELGSGSDG